MKRMMNRLLSAAWNKWYENAMDAKDQARKLRQGLMRMMNSKLAAAFWTWRERAAGESEQQRKLGGAMKRMMNRLLSAAWNQWYENAMAGVAAAAAREAEASRKAKADLQPTEQDRRTLLRAEVWYWHGELLSPLRASKTAVSYSKSFSLCACHLVTQSLPSIHGI